jgi:hypothetical protein
MAQPPVRVTATGWRVVGEAASLLSPTAALEPGPPPHADDVISAVQFRVKPKLGDPDDAALAAIDGVIAAARSGSGVIGRATHFVEATSKFHALWWDTLDSKDRWTAELAWRRVHPAIGGVAITDHLVLDRRHGESTLTVRTWADGGTSNVRGTVAAGQARSPLVPALAAALRLGFDGRQAEARTIDEDQMEGFVRGVLEDAHRRWPVAVLAPTETGEYHVDPDVLAAELLGLAHVYVIDRHRSTFALSDTIGDRQLSCYWGALRIYQPGFSRSDAGRSHPLLVADRVMDPVERTGLAGQLTVANRARVAEPDTPSRLREIEGPSKPKRVAEASPAFVTSSPATTAKDASPPPPPNDDRWKGVERAMASIAEGLKGLHEVTAKLTDEIVRLRAAGAVRAANAGGVERRLSQLERMLRDFITPPDPSAPAAEALPAGEQPPEIPDVTLVSVVQQASASCSDALLVLDEAVEAAAESPFEDVDRVAVILDTMAHIARRRQEGALGMSLRETFRDYGIDYRGGITKATPARFLEQYRVCLASGQEVMCDEHIVLGTSYDPRHCLRIYFSSRAAGEPRYVISHVGRHFDVSSTT